MIDILNLTQHPATEEQISAGVVEPENKKAIQDLLTFTGIPTREEIVDRAKKLAEIAHEFGASKTMIGGVPYLMGPLEKELRFAGIIPVYAYSDRVSIEEIIDGKVVKKSIFKHLGFVESASI